MSDYVVVKVKNDEQAADVMLALFDLRDGKYQMSGSGRKVGVVSELVGAEILGPKNLFDDAFKALEKD